MMPTSKYDIWSGRIRLLVMQFLGVADLIYQFFVVPQAQPLLVSAGAVLLGIPVVRLLDRFLA